MKELEIIIKNLLLKLFLAFKSKTVSEAPESYDKSSKLLFIRLNRIGDALATTPLLKAVKETLGCRIDVLADRKNHFIFRNNPFIDNVIVFNKGLKGFRETINMVRREKYNAVIDLHDDVSTTVTFLLALCHSPAIIGLKKENAIVFSHTVDKPDPSKSHIVERTMQIGKLLGVSIPLSEAFINFFPDKQAEARASDFAEKNFLKDKFILGINISAGSQARYWGTDNFISLISEMKKLNIQLLLLSSPQEKGTAIEIAEKSGILYYETPKFDDLAAIVAKFDLLFTPDTSIVQLASAYRVPLFGLYVKYNTENMIWSPYNTDYDCVITTESTLENMSFNDVFPKFKSFLDKYLYAKRNS
jgi:ADP-heptose:LPS heptosyltransferase